MQARNLQKAYRNGRDSAPTREPTRVRLTVKSEYALLALIDIASATGGRPVSVREIAERQEIPARFLEQVFASLRRAGVVNAVRGARGGFALGRDPVDVTVLDVVEAVEGPLRPSVCAGLRGGDCARNGACAAGSVMERASKALRDVFGGCTLAELAREQAGLDAKDRTIEDRS